MGGSKAGGGEGREERMRERRRVGIGRNTIVCKEKQKTPQTETYLKYLNRSFTSEWPLNIGKCGQCYYSLGKCKLNSELDISAPVSE